MIQKEWILMRSLVKVGFIFALGSFLYSANVLADSFTVDSVPVDVQAKNLAEAKKIAMEKGQRDAFYTLMRRLTESDDVSWVKLSQTEIMNMVADFSVISERMSKVRYIAKLSIRFDDHEVLDYLTRVGKKSEMSAANDASAAPVDSNLLVLPIEFIDGYYELWGEKTPWADSWETYPTDQSAYVLPHFDVDDVSSISIEDVMNQQRVALLSFAKRYEKSRLLVAKLKREMMPSSGNKGRIIVDLTLYSTGQEPRTAQIEKFVDPTTMDRQVTYAELIAQVLGIVHSASSAQQEVSSDNLHELRVKIPVEDFEQWLAIKDRLDQVSAIDSQSILAMSGDMMLLEVDYKGSFEQFKTSLSERGLVLTEELDEDSISGWVIRVRG
ncbi:MAG: DUF2066 domain-containing protein [Alphaproteobacteria bacterium]|nr:DUF2066 domain-containing protein [Alphaproteobacteria bacterium]MBP9877707.1 DUF2066 domain-containing protein [Alphaproteobacteria bacterium]